MHARTHAHTHIHCHINKQREGGEENTAANIYHRCRYYTIVIVAFSKENMKETFRSHQQI